MKFMISNNDLILIITELTIKYLYIYHYQSPRKNPMLYGGAEGIFKIFISLFNKSFFFSNKWDST